jgi:hypothetical protein
MAAVFLGLCLGERAVAGPSPIYANYAVIDTPPVVDALTFYNAGDILITTVTGQSPTNIISTQLEYGAFSSLPFMTKDTLNWTNSGSGLMEGIPGFQFDTGTSTSRHNASSFYNAGTVEGVDLEGFPYLFAPVGAVAPPVVPVPVLSQPIPSQLLVYATNINNNGTMAVGNCGLLNLIGNNVTNSFASLAAGTINTAGLINDPLDTTGLQGQESISLFNNGPYYFVPSPGVYDLFWGVTNALTVDLAGFDPPEGIPGIITKSRENDIEPEFPINIDTAEYSVTAILYTYEATNFYYDVIFVNTNFANTNLSATVGISGAFLPQYASTTTPIDDIAFENIVQFSEPVFDVISGQTVTNGIYLIDDGAILPSMTLVQNASGPGSAPGSGYNRPNAFELTTETPPEWDGAAFEALEFSTPYDPTLFFPFEEFSAQKVPFEISEYGAQISHNPANLAGSFDSLLQTNSFAAEELEFLNVSLPDPTNDPARIQISAGNLDETQSRMRAEGMVVLNVTNLVGGSTAVKDWGEMDANIGVTSGALVISNLFPTTFQRVRGDIYAWSATWRDNQTNTDFGNTNFPATNLWHFHVLVVDQNLYGSFPSTVRNLKLTGKSSIVLQDNLNVINQAVLNTTNLIVNSSNYFSQNAASFTPAFTPFLQNLFINTNGFLGAANSLDVGFNVNQAQAAPAGRKYIVNSITNYGQMAAVAPLLQAATIENDGQIIATGEGSMVIEANTLGLGLSLTNTTNYVLAGGDVNLSAANIEASNSVISAGLSEPANLTLYATEKLTDFVSGIPTTNTNSVIINHWTVTDGFALPVKPAIGDLFGTEIHTIATNFEEALHIWAGTDMGATPAGFVNNEVIGRLVLDRQSSNSVLRFSAAGAANAMYVDYLELTNFAYTNYRTGLVIDPNFTIYFAGCNFDPIKLTEIYPGLKWVQNYNGPNSTVVVPYLNSSNVCLMNTNLAFSFEISFFNGLPNIDNQPYVLNNPSDPSETYPCPGDEIALRSFLVSTPSQGGGQTVNLLNILVNGEGSITPELKTSQVALGESYSLTATAAKGWVFQNWSTIGLGSAVNASSHILPFNFVSNTVITANFIPNPFVALQGVYNGLFFEADAVNPGSSGAFALTLTPNGSFSGRLLMGPSTYSFSSQFSVAGLAQVQARSGKQSLTVNLQLDITGQTGQILGDINGGAWDAALAANIAPVWTSQNLAPLAGSYTMAMVLPLESGDSYGAGTVNKQGVLTLTGALADGVTFSESAPVSRDGQWPFYVYDAAGKDSVLGWVSVGNGLTGTNVTWSKAAGKGPLYAAGFTNVFEVMGSPWQAPGSKTSALTLTDPIVIVSGGGLPEPLTISVALQNYLTYSATNLTLSINESSGKFSGWFDSPGTGHRQTVSGVVLQNLGSARGFFQGTNESGAVLLKGQTATQSETR